MWGSGGAVNNCAVQQLLQNLLLRLSLTLPCRWATLTRQRSAPTTAPLPPRLSGRRATARVGGQRGLGIGWGRQLVRQGAQRPRETDAYCSAAAAAAAHCCCPSSPGKAGKMKALAREVRGFSGRTRLPIYAASAICVRYDPGALAGWLWQSGALLKSLLAPVWSRCLVRAGAWRQLGLPHGLLTQQSSIAILPFNHLPCLLPPLQTAWTRCGR